MGLSKDTLPRFLVPSYPPEKEVGLACPGEATRVRGTCESRHQDRVHDELHQEGSRTTQGGGKGVGK